MIEKPRGVLLDMGGTLVEQRSFDPEACTARVLELEVCSWREFRDAVAARFD